MEFNMTITAAERFEAGNQFRKMTLNKHQYLQLLNVTLIILSVLLIYAPAIAGWIILDDERIVAIYIAVVILLCLAIWLLAKFINRRYQRQNEVIIKQTHKYIIDAGKIRIETDHVVEEVKIDSFTFCFENDKRYLLGGPGSLHSFPKSEVEKLHNKDEFYQWIAVMKKNLNSTPSGRTKNARSDNSLSRLCRKMFLEDSRNKSQNDATKDKDN